MNGVHKLYSDGQWRYGAELSARDKSHVLAVFVHRYTGNHFPRWAAVPRADGTAYPLQFANDAEWLANTRFAVTAHGDLDRKVRECYSNPTWPNNPELRRSALAVLN